MVHIELLTNDLFHILLKKKKKSDIWIIGMYLRSLMKYTKFPID